MKKINLDEHMQELSFGEASEINGGESAWYWVAYGVGAVGYWAVTHRADINFLWTSA